MNDRTNIVSLVLDVFVSLTLVIQRFPKAVYDNSMFTYMCMHVYSYVC